MGDRKPNETRNDDVDSLLRRVAKTPDVSARPELTEIALLGRRIRQYEVVKLLGRGGMGQVFLANDRLLGREVAIKLLPPTFSPELQKRFAKEARSLAQVQHPSVATFYEAGQENGVTFLAMEYVPGETLQAHLARGPLAAGQMVRVFAMLLDGLAHIHYAGLVHRDIKPANVIVNDDGTTKLLDLGIATAMSVLDESSVATSNTGGGLTEFGAIVGSLDYMSPEQLRREPLDGRSDVFSLAVMTVEALMGRHPFRGNNPDETRARILAGEHAPLDLPDVDEAVREVLQTALALDRDQRHRHAAAAVRDLQRSAVASAARLPNSMTVLAFAESTDTLWAGSAAADELRRVLATVPGLRVLPRKRTELLVAEHSGDPTLVGLGAGCRWVVDGEIDRLRNDAWRLNARLRRVSTHALVESYSIENESLAGLASELGKLVAGAIGLAGSTPGNLAASDLVARTLELVYRGSGRGTLRDGMQLLEEAIAIEPDNVQALSYFGQLACLNYSATRDEAVIEVGHRRLERARELEPQNPHPHQWLGYYHGIRGTCLEGERSYARACELAPDDWQPHYFYAGTLALMSTANLSSLFRRIRAGEPPPPDLHRWARLFALDVYQRSIRISEKNSFAFWGVGALYVELGWFEDAIAAFERAVELEPISPLPTGGVAGFLAEALRRVERYDEAKAAARSALEITETNDHMYRDLFRAVALLALGRVNLDLSERVAARAFFEQARLLLEGRPQIRVGGLLLVEAQAGLACAGAPAALTEAKRLFLRRDTYSFQPIHGIKDHTALAQIARACLELGNSEADHFIELARAEGSLEVLEFATE